MSYITKIEVYPQVFFYDAEYLAERLGGSTIKAIKGRFFGVILDGGAVFTDEILNPLAPPANYLKFEVFAGENYNPTIDLAVTYQQFVEKFLYHSDVVAAVGSSGFNVTPYTSTEWYQFKITCKDGENNYVAPRPSNAGIMLPIRVRFYYVITYMSGEQEIQMAFPNQVNGYYETVFNADQPYRFLENVKEYAENEWYVFDQDGTQISGNTGTNPLTFEITQNSTCAYVLLKESIIGCYDNALMREKSMINSRVILNDIQALDEIKREEYSLLPQTIQSLIVPDWTFMYDVEAAKPADGQNVYDIKSSFVRRRCFKVQFNTERNPLLTARFIDTRTNEEYPLNGLYDAEIQFDSSEPIMSMDESVFTSLSDAIHTVKAKIDCSNAIDDYADIERSISFTLYSRANNNVWTRRTVQVPMQAPEIFTVNAGDIYTDVIFDALQKQDLEEMCSLTIGTTSAWIGTANVSYSGKQGLETVVIGTQFIFMLGLDNCINLFGASANVVGGVWKNSVMKVNVDMPSAMNSNIKSKLLARLAIISNGVTLKYTGSLEGMIRNSMSPLKQFSTGFADISFGTNVAVVGFTGNMAIANSPGSPIYLVNGTAIIYVTIKDDLSNSCDFAYGVEIPITGGDMNYTVSNPPDISEIDPKSETLISKV